MALIGKESNITETFYSLDPKGDVDFPLWSLTLYKICIENKMEITVFIDLNYNIDLLCKELEYSILIRDFSRLNCERLEQQKIHVILAVKLLSKTTQTLMIQNIKRMITTVNRFLSEKKIE